jgi:hypothetical protein
MENTTLNNILDEAIGLCTSNDDEQGGVILSKVGGEGPYGKRIDYQFVHLRNANTGLPLAKSLWTADRNEYAKKVIPLFKDGWRHFASFHTHPKWPAIPSKIDLTELFPGFPINYIYSGIDNDLGRFEFDDTDESWYRVEESEQVSVG